MKHTPIDSEHVGCGCCPPVKKVLPKEKLLDVGFGESQLIIKMPYGATIYREFIGGTMDNEQIQNVEDVENMYRDYLKASEFASLYFNAPLHDETYEYNKETGEWYLIHQGRGFA